MTQMAVNPSVVECLIAYHLKRNNENQSHV
jgi:hypothetical protein